MPEAETARIVVLPGDGIGPEVTRQAVRVLHAAASRFGQRIELEEYPVGGAAIDALGVPIADEAMARCEGAAAVLLGAVGGPKWDKPEAGVRPEQALFRLRRGLGLYSNLRPVGLHPALHAASPLRPELLEGVDLLIVRELTGGLYFGRPQEIYDDPAGRHAVDTLSYTEAEIERVLRVGFEAARGRRKHLTSVDKANVLATSRLWRQTAVRLAPEYPDVALDHMLVDSAAMRLVTTPAAFDVLVTENTFGDILSDEASVLAGSLGLLPSASVGHGLIGLYEPIHGTAPDIAGRGIANPLGAVLSVAMLLRHSLQNDGAARAVESAVAAVLDAGLRTADLARGSEAVVGTEEMGQAVLDALHRAPAEG